MRTKRCYLNQISNELKALREAKGLTLKQFANLFNATEPLDVTTSWRNISKYENKKNTMPADKYLKLKNL